MFGPINIRLAYYVPSGSNAIKHQTTNQPTEGDRVQSRSYANNKLAWKFGIVKKRIGKLHYLVQLDEGQTIKRHID